MNAQTQHKISSLMGVFLEMIIEDQRGDWDSNEILDLTRPLKIPHLLQLAREVEEVIPNIWKILAKYIVNTLRDEYDVYVFLKDDRLFIGERVGYNEEEGIMYFERVIAENGERFEEMEFNLAEALQGFRSEMIDHLIEANDTAEWDYDWDCEEQYDDSCETYDW